MAPGVPAGSSEIRKTRNSWYIKQGLVRPHDLAADCSKVGRGHQLYWWYTPLVLLGATLILDDFLPLLAFFDRPRKQQQSNGRRKTIQRQPSQTGKQTHETRVFPRNATRHAKSSRQHGLRPSKHRPDPHGGQKYSRCHVAGKSCPPRPRGPCRRAMWACICRVVM